MTTEEYKQISRAIREMGEKMIASIETQNKETIKILDKVFSDDTLR